MDEGELGKQNVGISPAVMRDQRTPPANSMTRTGALSIRQLVLMWQWHDARYHAGILILETQQSSDTTYRVYDS